VFPVGSGGTGLATATQHGVLLGGGTTSPLVVTDAGAASRALAVGAGGGAPSFQQITGAMIAATTIEQSNMGSSSVGSGQLKTSTGSASVAIARTHSASGAGTSSNSTGVVMNDYGFAPSLTYSVSGSGGSGSAGMAPQSTSDPGTTVPRLTLSVNATVEDIGGTSATTTAIARWRYVTASDDPTMWVVGTEGVLTGLWVSDDPTPNGEPGLEGGFLVKAWDLDALDIPEAALLAADERIAREGLKPEHRRYRALEVLAGGLPDRWIWEHCAVVNQKLVMR
jgi:hypothetical protein